jgi:hypothetical protein
MNQPSTRLRPDVSLYAVADGHVLRAAGAHHHVHLGPGDADALLDSLVSGGTPTTELAASALASLVDAGLVDPAPAHHVVVDDGVLADALRGALSRMGATVGPGGAPVAALDDPGPDGRELPVSGPACWVDEHLVVLAPPAVPARDVSARRRAATRHRDTDPRTRPLPEGRAVVGAPSRAGIELAATVVAAELLRRERPAYEAVVVDLHALTVTRHPVLPVPPAPR